MIPVSVLVAGRGTVSERIKGKYGKGSPSRFTSVIRPVVFWNVTYKCNLRCEHCYIDAGPDIERPELSEEEVARIAGEIARHEIPLVVFSGGEPLASRKFWVAAEKLAGLERPKLSLSTNGTLLTPEVAGRLRKLGFMYVGVSIDSLDPKVHDKFRGMHGAWDKALEGVKASVEAGIPTGLRFTLTRWNIGEAPGVLDLAAKLGASRVSYYLLDTVGRGAAIKESLPTHEQLKEFISRVMEKAREYVGVVEVLLVRMNWAGVYIAGQLAKDREDFMEYLKVVEAQGDCGRKTISIYPDGTVRPCQFIDYMILGSLKEKSLGEILSPENPRLKPFLEMPKRLRGPKCSKCPFKEHCGGGSRNRALALTGDFWGDDPTCIVDYSELASRFSLQQGLQL